MYKKIQNISNKIQFNDLDQDNRDEIHFSANMYENLQLIKTTDGQYEHPRFGNSQNDGKNINEENNNMQRISDSIPTEERTRNLCITNALVDEFNFLFVCIFFKHETNHPYALQYFFLMNNKDRNVLIKHAGLFAR